MSDDAAAHISAAEALARHVAEQGDTILALSNEILRLLETRRQKASAAVMLIALGSAAALIAGASGAPVEGLRLLGASARVMLRTAPTQKGPADE